MRHSQDTAAVRQLIRGEGFILLF